MALLVRAALSLEDDDDASTSYSLSSGASSPPPSPSPPPPATPSLSPLARTAVLGAPRVAAQLSFSDEDSSEAFDDSSSYGEDGELVQEVSNGFFFSVARVPPPPPEDPSPVPGDMPAGDASASVSGNLGAAEGSLEDSFVSSKSVFESIDAAGSRTKLEGDKVSSVEDLLGGSFQSSRSFIGALDDGEAAASGDFDGSVLMGDNQGDQDFDTEAVNDVVPQPVMADVGAIDSDDVHIVDALEGKEGASEHDFVELPPVVDAAEEEEIGIGSRGAVSDTKESTPKHGVVAGVEEASPEYVAAGDVDGQHPLADGGRHKLDEETDGGHLVSDDPASMPTSDSDDAVELLGQELEDNLPVSKGTRFGLDDSDEVEINGDDEEVEVDGKEFEHLDFAALAELLRAANISPGQGKTKVFPLETSKPRHLPPAVVSIPQRNMASSPVMEVTADPENEMTDEEKKLYRKVNNARIKYLRLIHRLGYDTDHRVPVQVLYRLSLVEGLRRIRIANHSSELETAWKRALQLEAERREDLEFSCNILVLAALPEGPSGSAMNYEMVVTHRTHSIQQSIRQATNDPRIENPVALVENHHLCRRNMEGEKVLPDGLIWRRLLLLLCYSLKMVAEIDSFSTRCTPPASLFGRYLQLPPLPYFLSSLRQSREHPRHANDQNLDSVVSGVDLDEFLNGDQEEEDDYDQLPPFKPLSKSEVVKLSKEQQELYFDEYDYRTKLLQKKQLKEQLRRTEEMKKRKGNNQDACTVDNSPDAEYDTDRSPMSDWTLPSSFDSDDPVYRYRCLEPSPNLLLRAVPNPDGWDHDFGFDGVSLQHSLDVVDKFPASLWVQVNKDKREFTIYLDSSISAKHGDYASTLAGFDIRTMMDQLAYTLRSETKFKNFKKNVSTGGLSMTFLGNTMVTGAKFEDKLSVGNRLTLVANTGAVSMRGDTAYEVNMEATVREKSYPIGQSLATMGASLVRWRKEWTMAANFESQFSVGRTSNMAVHVDVNNKLTGRVSIKASTSEQLKIALLGICSATMYLWNKMHSGSDPYSQ
ncbi:hypothetical protein PR202_gb10357 [Eleusine coracana subsp. coracana]|uniref:Translocase of chloroplast 159/132 membrane anchor domain-containing protein n=1 Tax=Eleusine coracana subsp. coracana TaxID=191504 RepID=A0AAV5EJS0_ELECO|nr:hypothetical protein PR202_gb10357 [Eleusine coracana subsp. coracana]